MTLTKPIPFHDEHGTACLNVPLTNAPGVFAQIDRHSFLALQRLGLTGPWFLNGNGSGKRYVRANVPERDRRNWTPLLVARLIIGAGPGTVVRYANGDPLDLRFINLAWRKGRSSRADTEVLADANRLIAERNATNKETPTMMTTDHPTDAPELENEWPTAR